MKNFEYLFRNEVLRHDILTESTLDISEHTLKIWSAKKLRKPVFLSYFVLAKIITVIIIIPVANYTFTL